MNTTTKPFIKFRTFLLLNMNRIIFIIALGIFYTLSIIIIILSFVQTKKLGKVRAQYIRHHRVILIILLSAWLFPLWTNILIQLGDQSSDHFYIVNLVSFVTLLLLGALVNIVRFYNDRFLWEQVNFLICKIYRLRKWSNAKKQENIKLTSKMKKINMVKQNQTYGTYHQPQQLHSLTIKKLFIA